MTSFINTKSVDSIIANLIFIYLLIDDRLSQLTPISSITKQFIKVEGRYHGEHLSSSSKKKHYSDITPDKVILDLLLPKESFFYKIRRRSVIQNNSQVYN